VEVVELLGEQAGSPGTLWKITPPLGDTENDTGVLVTGTPLESVNWIPIAPLSSPGVPCRDPITGTTLPVTALLLPTSSRYGSRIETPDPVSVTPPE
jgi:hypothetical protein